MGKPDVDGMLEGMTSRELSEWVAFSAVEPFGEARMDYRVAYALAHLVALFRGESDGPPVRVEDFLPHIGALADEDRAGWERQDRDLDKPPVHPNVAWFEQMMQQG